MFPWRIKKIYKKGEKLEFFFFHFLWFFYKHTKGKLGHVKLKNAFIIHSVESNDSVS